MEQNSYFGTQEFLDSDNNSFYSSKNNIDNKKKSSSLKTIAVVGSTGSIGTQTLDVISKHPDKLNVGALAAFSQTEKLFRQAKQFNVPYVVVGDKSKAYLGKKAAGQQSNVFYGKESLLSICSLDFIDTIVNSIVGAAGLTISYQSLLSKKRLAIANKESLVVGGDLLMPLAKRLDKQYKTLHLLPIDSEHGAIFQCLMGEDKSKVKKLWITASGGPFRGKKEKDLLHVTSKQALSHPTWQMGPKISIDSSTLMNKGLEVIEAHHLFSMPFKSIKVVVHPESKIHSMVEFCDGSVKAHLGATDMRIPIQFALSFPYRWDSPVESLDFTQLGTFSFESPDIDTFKCLALAYKAGEIGGTLPAIMNAANEVAVKAFINNEITFLDIACIVQNVMEKSIPEKVESIEQLLEVDKRARILATQFL